MLTKITDDLYVDLSDIVYFDIDRKLEKALWQSKNKPFDFTASVEIGELIKAKLDEYLEFACLRKPEPSEEYKKFSSDWNATYKNNW